MKKRTIYIVVILMIAIFLIPLNQFDVLEKSAKFIILPNGTLSKRRIRHGVALFDLAIQNLK